MVCRSYIEWLDRGFQVQYGERNVGRNKAGICVFTEHQVRPIGSTKKPRRPSGSNHRWEDEGYIGALYGEDDFDDLDNWR